jgi:CheY-like chemotaxis protein
MHFDANEGSLQPTVLYVEDEIDTRQSLAKVLSRYFKKVACASNGKEALDFYHKEKFDLVLTDIDMPIMDGFELIREIRKLNKLQPIIVSSGHKHDHRLTLEMLSYGVIGFLEKPINFDDFHAIIAKVHNRPVYFTN